MNKTFTTHYSPKPEESFLQEKASMEKPLCYDGGVSIESELCEACCNFDNHLSQLAKYSAPWLSAEHPKELELGVHFEVVNQNWPESGLNPNDKPVVKHLGGGHAEMFAWIAVPLPVAEGSGELTVNDFIHLGIEFSKKIKTESEPYRLGTGFGYSCGYQDGLKAATHPKETEVESRDESAEHIEPVVGVEEAAKEWNIDYESSSDLNTDLETAFKAGASWQSQQPVSDAVEFAEWVHIKSFGGKNKGVWNIADGALTTEELYSIFKHIPEQGKQK